MSKETKQTVKKALPSQVTDKTWLTGNAIGWIVAFIFMATSGFNF